MSAGAGQPAAGTGLVFDLTAERPGGRRLAATAELPGRGVVGVFGPSGAGKTWLLRALAGLEPARGSIRVADAVWLDSERRIALPPHRREVGLVFQDGALFPHLTVGENLRYGQRRARAGWGSSLAEVAGWLALDGQLARRPADLSAGERQRVAIARALLRAPRLLLLDEPVANLDAPARREILDLLAGLRERLAVPMLLVSHTAADLARLADRLLVVDAGTVREAPLEALSEALLAGLELEALARVVPAERLAAALARPRLAPG